jgi:hypothetical protein
MKQMKLNKSKAAYFTIAGLLISIIGQHFIGKLPIPAVILTTLGFVIAGFGVWLAFFKK